MIGVGSQMTIYKPHEMAEKLGVSVKTLQRWDVEGKLKALRTPTNRRYYTDDQYYAYIGKVNQDIRKTIAYARVSNNKQKAQLQHQIDFIQTYVNAKGVILDEIITDIGSCLNYERKAWNQLLQDVMLNKVSTIYITYKDRFVRFGYSWFERLCEQHGTKIIVLNNKKTSSTEEMVEDILSIVHVFSSRLYGLRKYKTQIKNDTSLTGDNNDTHAKS